MATKLVPQSFLSGFFDFSKSKILNGGLTISKSENIDAYDWEDYGLGDQEVNNSTIGQGPTILDKIVRGINTNKSKPWVQKALMLLATYGPLLLEALSNRAGKNIGMDEFLQGLSINKVDVDGIISDTGGSGNPKSLNNEGNREADVLGLKTSTWVLLSFALLVLNMFKDSIFPKGKKRN